MYLFYSLNCGSANQLQRRLESVKFVYGDWVLIPTSLQAEKLQIVRLRQQQLQCSLTPDVLNDLLRLLQLPSSQYLTCVEDYYSMLFLIQIYEQFWVLWDGFAICESNLKFAPIFANNKGIFKDRILYCL